MSTEKNTLLVTAYFKLNKSKLSHDIYIQYAKRFFNALAQNKIPTIFFTTDDVHQELQTLIPPNVKVISLAANTEECLPKLTAYRKWGREFWNNHFDLDQEKNIHSPELAMLWYEKPHFILRAADLMPSCLFYVWVDFGCIRNFESESVFTHFTKNLIQNIDEKKDVLHLQCLNTIEKKEFYQFHDRSIAAAIMFGTKKAFAQHVQLYDEVLYKYNSADKCGSKDQHIIRSCVDQDPTKYHLHFKPDDLKVDEWFFFLQIL